MTLDSGILVRGSASPSGPAARLIEELAPPKHRLILSEFILDEFRRVLGYPRIRAGLNPAEIGIRANRFRLAAEIIEPSLGAPVVLADAKDDPIVYTAVAGKANVLCTLDRHFYAPNVLEFLGRRGIRVRSDVDLLRELLS